MKKLALFFLRVIELLKLWYFENQVNRFTWKNHNQLFDYAMNKANNAYPTDEGDTQQQEWRTLRNDVLIEYKNKYDHLTNFRVLVHVPPKKVSAGGHSVFMSIVDSLNYIGISSRILNWDDNLNSILDDFKPTIFLTSNNTVYLKNIDWSCLQHYRRLNTLLVGLSASVDDFSDPHNNRQEWIRSNSIDFFYGFRSEEYFQERKDYYSPILDAGYSIFSWEFGANIEAYYPVSGIEKDLNYVFLASSNSDKRERYLTWLTKLVNKYPGFINGPGWLKINKSLPQKAHKYIYARAKVGINLHIDDSIIWPSELNERTYILAACGVPQLIDNAKLLDRRFNVDGFFAANTPEEYFNLFEYALNNPEEGKLKAMIALKEVYSKHTTFHRAEKFVNFLLEQKKVNDGILNNSYDQ